jgi:glycosyltransferase involved in cell wall biosynthesis
LKKNILILNYEYPPLGGGGGVASEKLANGWVKAGYNVDVITSDFRKLPKREKRNGVNIYRVKTFGRKDQFSAHFFCLLTYLFFGFLMSIHLCRSKSYAFINTHFVLPTGPLGFSIQKIFRIKNVLSLHGGDVYDPSKKTSPHKHIIFRIIIRFLLNQSDFVVAQSSNTKKNTIRYYTPTREIHVIPLAYEPILFPQKTRSDLGLKQEKQYLISTGRLVERKGYTYLIRALSMLDDHIELILIGDGPQKKSLLSLVRNLGLKKRIHFMGYVSEEVKMQLLDVADIYVLSSLHEGFGIVLQGSFESL